MSLESGLYKVSFQTPLGIGFGVAVLENGVLRGGDSSMFYVGRYEVDGDELRAQVDIDQHSAVAGIESVLGTTQASLSLAGKMANGIARFSGSARQAPGIILRASLQRIA